MRWLVTLRAHADLLEAQRRLTALGCQVDEGAAPSMLEDSSHVLAVTGPADLPNNVQGDPIIEQVYPDSTMELY